MPVYKGMLVALSIPAIQHVLKATVLRYGIHWQDTDNNPTLWTNVKLVNSALCYVCYYSFISIGN